MESLVDIVMFHARTPTLLPFACASTLRAYREYPESRRTSHAREYVVTRHSGWDAVIRLSVHGLLTGVAKRWLADRFSGDVLEYAVKDAEGNYRCRKEFGHDCEERSWARDHYRLCRRTLKRLGLLEIMPPDWLATRFEYDDLAKALIQGGHAGMGREWYEATFKKDPDMLAIVLRRFGLTPTTGEPEDHTGWSRDQLKAKYGKGAGLVDRLEDAGLLNDADEGREWLAKNLDSYNLLDALRRGRMLTSDASREWYAKHMHKSWWHSIGSSHLLSALDEAGLLTAEPGRDWYAKHFSGEYLYNALKAAGLLTRDQGVAWYKQHFRDGRLFDVFKETGMLESCTAAQLAAAFSGRSLFLALKHGGKLTPATAQTREWYASNLGGTWLLPALRRTGLLTAEPGRDWYAKRLKGALLVQSLEETGLLTAEPGREWYVGHLRGKSVRPLYDAMSKSGLLTAEPGRDWYITLAGERKIGSVNNPVFMMLRDAGLLTVDAGAQWYKEHFKKRAMYEALELAGLMPRDESPAYYAEMFRDRALYEVLVRTGAVRRIESTEWVDRRMAGYGRVSKYADMALYRAGLLTEDLSHRWFASHLEGQELFDALDRHGLFGKPPTFSYWRMDDYNWYGRMFSGELLMRALKKAGLIPHMPSKYIFHLFDDPADRAEAKRIKRDYWRGKRYPYPMRSTGPTWFGYDRDGDWSVQDTDSRNSAGYGSTFVESATSSNALIGRPKYRACRSRVREPGDSDVGSCSFESSSASSGIYRRETYENNL